MFSSFKIRSIPSFNSQTFPVRFIFMTIPFRGSRHKTKLERSLFGVPLCSGQFYLMTAEQLQNALIY